MAKNTIADLDTTASNNTDVLGQSTSGTAAVSTIDTMIQNSLGLLARFYADLGGTGTVGGTADAITLTTASTYQALESGLFVGFKAGGTNTGATTINVDGLGAKAIRRRGDTALQAGDILDDGVYLLRYDTAYNTAAGAWVLLNPEASVAVETTWQSTNTPINLSLAASVGSSALTIAIKGHDGNDPSSSNKVYVPFRSVTPGSGDNDVLTLTAATSLVISSGSTLGAPTSSVPFKVWVVGFNDGGTFRLGAILCTTLASGVLTQFPLAAYGIASSTAEGGAGAADSARVFYTGAAVTSKAYTVLGVLSFESGLATAGTWAAAPTRTQVFDPSVPLPGRVVQICKNVTGAAATGSTTIPFDDTTPQSSEGTQYMSQAITPSSTANLLAVEAQGFFSAAGAAHVPMPLFQDSVADALTTSWVTINAGTNGLFNRLLHHMVAATTSATTFKVRAGSGDGTAVYFNQPAAATPKYNGTMNSFMAVSEISA